MAWSANLHGLLWFIDEVMPLLKQTHPHARLLIAGFGTPDSKFMQHIRGRKDIVFLGEQKDERPLLSQSQVFVVPLWIGAGARVKILTAWAAGIPVVSTTVGAEGLACTDGENILVADQPSEFAEKVARLMEDEDLARRLSRNGRALVEQRYSLDYAAREYDRIYNSIGEGAGSAEGNRRPGANFEEKEQTMRQLLGVKADMALVSRAYKDALIAMQRSLVWRAMARYDRVISRLLPEGTKRRVPYSLALGAVRTIVNEGWGSFFRKARTRLKLMTTRGSSLPDLLTRLRASGKDDVLLQYMLSHIAPGSVIYDVGGYNGLYSILLADKLETCVIYAFEPNPAAFAELVGNISHLGLEKRITPLNAALDECCGTRLFNISSDPGRSSFSEYNATYGGNRVAQSILVKCYSIDYLVEKGICKPPDVIKIDAEGNEHRVVFGAKRVIASRHPKICFEPHGLGSENASTAQPIKEFLSQFGYRFQSLGYPIWCYKPLPDEPKDADSRDLGKDVSKGTWQ